jgi:hypothetical protein
MTAIGSVRLARAPARLLAGPVAIGLVGAIVAAIGFLLGGPLGVSVLTAGAIVLVVAIYLAALVLSIRLRVEAGSLVLRWLGGNRRYGLVRGSVTRVTVRGTGSAPLRTSLGLLGWGIGRATLRGNEQIQLIRLAPTASMILIPTDRGRLAIAAAADDELLAMLATAARLQTRAAAPATPLVEQAVPVAPTPAPGPPEQPRVLTGIERALLEERLSAERAAALAAAEAEREAAEAERQAAEAERQAEDARQAPAQAPMHAAAVVDEAVLSAPAAAVIARRAPRERAFWRRPSRRRVRRPSWLGLPAWTTLPPLAGAVLPMVAPALTAAAVWIVALANGRLDVPLSEARYLSLAFVLAGPVAAVGLLVARVWQPRMRGLVACTALAAQVLLVRVLIG